MNPASPASSPAPVEGAVKILHLSDLHFGSTFDPSLWEYVMITLTIIFLLIFVPTSRGVLRGFVSCIFSLLGLAFLVTRNSGDRRGGL